MTDINAITITDPVYKEKSTYNFLEKFIISLLNDKRDMAFIKLSALICVTTIPFAIYLLIPGNFHWWLILIYYVYNFAFLTGTARLNFPLASVTVSITLSCATSLYVCKVGVTNCQFAVTIAPAIGWPVTASTTTASIGSVE